MTKERKIPPVIGDQPGPDIPGEVIFDSEDITTPNDRFKKLKEWAIANKKKLVATSTIGGVIVVTVASAWMVKHYLDKHPEADLTKTDKP